jgi:hypothetical protein
MSITPHRKPVLRRHPLLRIAVVACLAAVVYVPATPHSVAKPSQIPLVIDEKLDESGVPAGWELRVHHNSPQIQLERVQNGRVAIRLKSEISSFGLHKEVTVDLKEFPILTWKWKVDRLPPHGDIREKSKDDQAAQVYVVFPRSLLRLRSPTIGYLWDSNAPVGTVADGHSVVTPIKNIVLQSGEGHLGEWVVERRNVLDDYQRLFGKGSVPKVGAVAIWTNTQHTKSSAEAAFADLRFVRP